MSLSKIHAKQSMEVEFAEAGSPLGSNVPLRAVCLHLAWSFVHFPLCTFTNSNDKKV